MHVQEVTLLNDADILLGNRKFSLFNPWCSTRLTSCDSKRKQKHKLFSMFVQTHDSFYTILALWNTIMNDFLQKKVFTLWHTDPRDDTVFNGVMDWFKALRWSRLRMHNNSISTSQPTWITKVTCTPLLRHLHQAPQTYKRMLFLPPPCFCSLYPSLVTFPPASLLQPRSQLRNPEEIQEYGRDFLIKTMFPQIPLLPPLLVHALLPCSSVPTPCLKQRMGEGKSGGVQQLRAQGYSTKMNSAEWGERGRGALTRREQHNLINTNARSKLFKHASNSALTRSRNTTDGWANQRRWDAITCGAATHTHARSNTRRSKRGGGADAFDESR